MVRLSGKKKICQKKNFSQTSATTETLATDWHNIEVEYKCIERRKWCDNSSVKRKNAFIPDNNDDNDDRAKIFSEEIDKSIVAYLEPHIQHFKDKAYYKASNNQRSINTFQ